MQLSDRLLVPNKHHCQQQQQLPKSLLCRLQFCSRDMVSTSNLVVYYYNWKCFHFIFVVVITFVVFILNAKMGNEHECALVISFVLITHCWVCSAKEGMKWNGCSIEAVSVGGG